MRAVKINPFYAFKNIIFISEIHAWVRQHPGQVCISIYGCGPGATFTFGFFSLFLGFLFCFRSLAAAFCRHKICQDTTIRNARGSANILILRYYRS